MEPDGLKELKSYLYSKIQKYHDSDTKLTKSYLKAIAAVDRAERDKYDLATLYSSLYLSEFNGIQYYAQADCMEEIEDKDLGLVRKINLN